jgi:hypothetical protein
MPGVLVVDSIQTARTEARGTEKKERVDAVIDLLKSARKRGLIVITTSEVSRAFYAKVDDRVDPLAAFKESGDIEYALDLALVLISVKDQNGALEVWIPKNRIAPKHDRNAPAFRASIDFARAKMQEKAAEEAHVDPEAAAKREAVAVAELGERIVRALLAAKGDVLGVDGVIALLGGSNRQRTTRALEALRAHGRLVGGGRGNPFRLVSPGSEADE